MKNKDIIILNALKNQLTSELKSEIDKIILFGSRAYGRAKKNSDYDLLLILNIDNYDWRYKTKIIDYIYDLELENDVMFDVHIISNYELNNTLRGKQPIFTNAIEKGIYI